MRSLVGVDAGACLKGGLPGPTWGQHGGAGLQDCGSSCLSVTSGEREAPGSFGFQQEAACSYLPAPAALSTPKLLVEPLPGEPPRWGRSLQLQTRKPWLRGRGQAQHLGLGGLGDAMPLGAENGAMTQVLTCIFCHLLLRCAVSTLV